MRKQQNMVDAVAPLKINVKECHVLDGIHKDQKNCLIARAGKDDGDIEDIAVHHNYVWVKFYGKRKVVRYKTTPSVREFIVANDRRTIQFLQKNNLLKIPEDGHEVVLIPPTGYHKLKNLRSAKHIAVQKASYEKRKGEKKKRAYSRDPRSLNEIRKSQGYSMESKA